MNNRVPLTAEEQQRRAAALSRSFPTAEIPSILECERQNGKQDDRKVVFEDSELLPGTRTPEQQRAYDALHGDCGFSSWERFIRNAQPENRPSVLRNALVELYPLADRAAVSHVEIADWAIRAGELYSVGDADELQRITVEAESSAHTVTTGAHSPSPMTSDRLRPLDLKQFLQLSIKTREMLLDPILPEKGLAMLYAARGTGKTHVALGIAFAVATGTKFLKWSAPKATPRPSD